MGMFESVGQSRAYDQEGRIAGSYVYFLCCASDTADDVYIKIGLTDFPTRRLPALVHNCPLKALSFGTVHVSGRAIARKIEKLLHRSFKEQRVSGEWFKFNKTQKAEFAAKRDAILAPHKRPAWPMNVELIAVAPVMQELKQRQKAHLRKRARWSPEYRRFVDTTKSSYNR